MYNVNFLWIQKKYHFVKLKENSMTLWLTFWQSSWKISPLDYNWIKIFDLRGKIHYKPCSVSFSFSFMTPVRPFFLSFSATVYPSRMRPWFSCANNWRSCLRSARWNRPWEWPWPWRRPERKPVPTRKLHYHWLMRTQSERTQTVWSAGKGDCC